MTRHEGVQPPDLDQLTLQLAAKEGIQPNKPLYRYLHPMMIAGVENGKLLIAGNNINGVRIKNFYQAGGKTEQTARSLPEPGLNFTTEFRPTYKTAQRRTLVSLKMSEQPKGLRFYKDVGSETRSVYLTLPHDEKFRVDAGEFDVVEVATALHIRTLMEKDPPFEEPMCKRDYEDEARVLIDFKIGKEKWDQYNIVFHKVDSLFIMQPLKPGSEKHPLLELLAVYRLFMEDRTMSAIIGASGTHYTQDELLKTIQNIPQYKQLLELQP